MHRSLLIFALTLACCGRKEAPPPPEDEPPVNVVPPPTATTAFLFNASFTGGAELLALDLETREQSVILEAPALGTDSIVRVFNEMLYIVARDYVGQENSLTVIDPKNGYALACSDCQWPLGEATNVQDFWVVSADKAYFTTQPGSSLADAWAHRNAVSVMNPMTGAITKRIDIAAALVALGDTLPQDDDDGTHELGALYADAHHLFVAISALTPSYNAVSKGTEPCGVVPGRVAVIDLDTDEVVKVIVLSGSNPAPSPARFVPQPQTSYLLISTPGSLGTAEIDHCGGIERIDQQALVLGSPFATEGGLGGSVMSFDLDEDGNGVVFLFVSGDFEAPTYEVRRFQQTMNRVDPALVAPGVKGFSQPSFVEVNDHGLAFVGLPLRAGAEVATFHVSDGTSAAPSVALDLPPIDVAFYPGVPYVR